MGRRKNICNRMSMGVGQLGPGKRCKKSLYKYGNGVLSDSSLGLTPAYYDSTL